MARLCTMNTAEKVLRVRWLIDVAFYAEYDDKFRTQNERRVNGHCMFRRADQSSAMFDSFGFTSSWSAATFNPCVASHWRARESLRQTAACPQSS